MALYGDRPRLQPLPAGADRHLHRRADRRRRLRPDAGVRQPRARRDVRVGERDGDDLLRVRAEARRRDAAPRHHVLLRRGRPGVSGLGVRRRGPRHALFGATDGRREHAPVPLRPSGNRCVLDVATAPSRGRREQSNAAKNQRLVRPRPVGAGAGTSRARRTGTWGTRWSSGGCRMRPRRTRRGSRGSRRRRRGRLP